MHESIKENRNLLVEENSNEKVGGVRENLLTKEEKRQIVEIFWTGGYDSTFRVVQLSKKNIVIRSYYISDRRKSENYELSAIKEIAKILSERIDTKAIIEPITVINMEMRQEYERDIYKESWEKINENIYLGSQYVWLAGFAEKHKGIELSVHKDDKAIVAIEKYCNLKKIENNYVGDTYVIGSNEEKENDLTICIKNIFKNFSFPLAEYTKLQMRDMYIKNGYKEIMDCTWFCYRPIGGKPCGRCNPCMYTIEEGLKERFTKKALVMYTLKKIKKKVF